MRNLHARNGRNPKTGESVNIPNRRALHFKPGKDLRDRVNASKLVIPIQYDD